MTNTPFNGCASIADTSGNLQFYTNGKTIWNQSHQVMANGTGLAGEAAQSAIIIKQPGNNPQYYVFTQGGVNNGLRYSIVDMSLSSGQGSVTVKNATLMSACYSKLAYTRHCNGNDYWIMAQENEKLNFRTFLLTSSGVNTLAVASNFSNLFSQSGSLPCSMKFSPNGNKLAVIVNYANCGNSFWDYCSVQFYDFNRSTGTLAAGTISGPMLAFENAYSCEFSPDGKKLYFSTHRRSNWNYSTWTGSGLYQFDICGQQIKTIESNSSTSLKGTLQLAKDGKIYVAKPGSFSIGAINNPNSTGLGCNYAANAISTGTAVCGYALPNFMDNYFEQGLGNQPLFSYTSQSPSCLTVSFTPLLTSACSGYSISNYSWSFGDPASGVANSSSLSNPVHTYSSSGSYTVQLLSGIQCQGSDHPTLSQVVHVTSPTLSAISPSASCGVISATAVTSGGVGPFSYTWSPSSQTTSVANALGNGTYTVAMQDLGGGCSLSSTVAINPGIINATINASSPACFGSNTASANIVMSGGSGLYNYSWSGNSSNSPVILSGLSAGQHSVVVNDLVNQCSVIKNFVISQNPAIQIGMSTPTYTGCAGGVIHLNAIATGGSGGFTYNWTGGPASQNYPLSQTLPGNYVHTVTATDANNCSSTATVNTSFINPPTIYVNNALICQGNTGTLVAMGAASYTWLPSGVTGFSFSASPSTNTSYTIIGNSQGCSSSTVASLLVSQSPTAVIVSNNPQCSLDTLTLNGSGGFSYTWNGPQGFVSYNQSTMVGPLNINQSGIYSLTVVGNNFCSSTSTISVNITPQPNISVAGNTSICAGATTTLLASGASTYTWSNGSVSASNVVSPGSTSVFTVTGAQALSGCKGQAVVTVSVNDCNFVGLPESLNPSTELMVYPNPGNGKFVLNAATAMQITLYNSLGQLILSQYIEPGATTINLTRLSEGVYLLDCHSGNKVFVKRLIKRD